MANKHDCFYDNEKIENTIRERFSQKQFDFSDDEWLDFQKKGYNKLDIAKLCCEHVVIAEVECYERRLIVSWNGDQMNEGVVSEILEHSYDQWVNIDENSEVEYYCCEEWMIKKLKDFDKNFDFYVIYDEEKLL